MSSHPRCRRCGSDQFRVVAFNRLVQFFFPFTKNQPRLKCEKCGLIWRAQ